jgi:hypothetical protein
MIAHLLGNGPSKKDFINDPSGDIFGCNLGEPTQPLKASFVMDKLVIDHIADNKLALPYPIILPHALRRRAEQVKEPDLKVLDVVPTPLRSGESTGHKAMVYLLERYDEVHMWGFDSLKVDTVKSDTHEKIPKGPADPKNYLRWRKAWQEIFRTAEERKKRIVIHYPSS